jgi:hypothetical protein
MNSNLKVIIPVIIALFVGLAIAGIIFFKGNTQTSLQLGQNYTTPSPEPTAAVIQTMGQIVSGFPDFPSYPSANVTSSQINQATETTAVSYQAYFNSTDNVSTVINWYTQNLQASGWTIDRPADPLAQPDDQNIVVEKNGQKATVNAELEGDEGTSISIYIS